MSTLYIYSIIISLQYTVAVLIVILLEIVAAVLAFVYRDDIVSSNRIWLQHYVVHFLIITMLST